MKLRTGAPNRMTIPLVAVVASVVLLSLVSFSRGAPTTDEPKPEGYVNQCRGQKVDVNVTEEYQKILDDCLKEHGDPVSLNIPSTNFACYTFCTFSKSGLFDKDAKPIKENFVKLVGMEIPEKLHADLGKLIGDCLKPENLNGIDSKDKSCTSYLPLVTCIQATIPKVCGESE